MGDNIYLGDRDGVRTPMQWSAGPERGLLGRQPAEALPARRDRPRVPRRGGQRRVAAGEPAVAALVDAAPDRAAQAAPAVRPRRDRVPAAREPQGADVPAHARRRAHPRRREPLALRAVRRARPVRVPGHDARRAARRRGVPARSASCRTCSRSARTTSTGSRSSSRRATSSKAPVCRSSTCAGTGCRSSRARAGARRSRRSCPPGCAPAAGSARRRGACARPRSRTPSAFPTPQPQRRAPRLPAARPCRVHARATARRTSCRSPAVAARAPSRALAPTSLALLHCGDGDLVLHEPLHEPRFARALLDLIPGRKRLAGARGLRSSRCRARACASLRGENLEPSPAAAPSRATPRSSSATSSILKLFRRVEEGENPDVEISRALTERTTLANVAPLRGALEYRPDARRAVDDRDAAGLRPERGRRLALHARLDRPLLRGRARAAAASRRCRRARSSSCRSRSRPRSRTTRSRATSSRRARSASAPPSCTPRSHSIDDPAFAPEPLTLMARRALYQSMRTLARQVFADAAQAIAAELPGGAALLEREADVLERFKRAARPDARRRAHARARRLPPRPGAVDGQGLRDHRLRGRARAQRQRAADQALAAARRRRDAALVPLRRLLRAVRRARRAIRSARARRSAARPARRAPGTRSSTAPVAERWARFWYAWSAASYLRAYLESARAAGFLPGTDHDVDVLLHAHMLEKAAYELRYEANNRPDWLQIPARGILQLLEGSP